MKVKFLHWYNALAATLLSLLGFSSCDEFGNEEQRNKWLEKQWRAWRDKDSDGDNSVFKKYFSSETSEKANHFWYKSPLTMAMICDTEDSCLFTEKFLEMCEFFSH